MKTVAELRKMIDEATPSDGDDPRVALRRLAEVQAEVASAGVDVIEAMIKLGQQLAHNESVRVHGSRHE